MTTDQPGSSPGRFCLRSTVFIGDWEKMVGRSPPVRRLAAALLLAAGLGTAPPPAGAEQPPQPGKHWQWQVYAEDLPAVDNLAIGPDGSLYATLEHGGGNGQVVRLHDGRQVTVLGGLNRPDGLLIAGRRLYVTEEVPEGRVIELDLASGRHRTLARLHKPEGLGMLPGGELVVSEDQVSGRLVRLRRDGTAETLTGGLNRPEGLAVAADGAIYVAETGTGRVLCFRNGLVETLVVDLDEPDQVKLAPDGALWITEDARPGRLLRFKAGMLETVLSGLQVPQGIAFRQDGTVLVAEQGRGRILALRHTDGK